MSKTQTTSSTFSFPLLTSISQFIIRQKRQLTISTSYSLNHESKHLEKGSLSVFHGIVLATSAMAPALAVVLNAPAAGSKAGAALPLSFLLAFIACLFVGNTIIQFSRKLSSAGSFYTYNSYGFGSIGGFFTGWLLFIGYSIVTPALFTVFGSFIEDYIHKSFHTYIPWWIFSLIGLILVIILSILGIKTSLPLDLTLLIVQIIVFIILSTIIIIKAGNKNNLGVFSPLLSVNSFSGVGFGTVFGILSFIGFDAPATLGEEMCKPNRTIPMAIGGSLILVGLFYIFVCYSLSIGYELMDPIHLQIFMNDSNPFITLAREQGRWLEHIVSICAVIGIFSCFLAIHNTSVRILFSMGRDRILPHILSRVHQRWFSPYVAILILSVFTLIVGLPIGMWLGPGVSGCYGFTSTIGALAIIIVYMASNISLICYTLRTKQFHWLWNGILPILGFLVLLYPLWSIGRPGQSYPYNIVPYVLLIWLFFGVILFLYFFFRSPEKLKAIGSMFDDNQRPQTDQAQSVLSTIE
ncbi:unnamed protein product [Didymodactylos carnosus]|uniref:Uncharacterized protein n=1 Tax=Didymodactylos carnosus TaxID=1234261 RepID=A0A814H353_9BILA|nr:unnamed protein product [Didymodactylos carnosus]CAF1279647.1 unnamed protein product [Didymodactylos carnosus]CAF3776132.1 unnamed protein product [Didymodactylos carnosus]CAF4084510.1 unnamed protein product [Didymodactylos carnosus]